MIPLFQTATKKPEIPNVQPRGNAKPRQKGMDPIPAKQQQKITASTRNKFALQKYTKQKQSTEEILS